MGNPALQLREFSAGYKNKQLLLPTNLTFPSSGLIALIGRNGSGKSTILRGIAGVTHDFRGEIYYGSERIDDVSASKRARILSFVNTQRPRISNMSARMMVGLGRAPYTDWIGRLTPEDEEIIRDALDKVGMLEFAERSINTMSDGECQKVMVARAIAQDTQIILLDEPTSFLDLPTRHRLVEMLTRLTRQTGKTIIYSTHELDIAIRYSDYISILSNKKLSVYPANDISTRKIVEEEFNLENLF